jgi:hypothetical protein
MNQFDQSPVEALRGTACQGAQVIAPQKAVLKNETQDFNVRSYQSETSGRIGFGRCA